MCFKIKSCHIKQTISELDFNVTTHWQSSCFFLKISKINFMLETIMFMVGLFCNIYQVHCTLIPVLIFLFARNPLPPNCCISLLAVRICTDSTENLRITLMAFIFFTRLQGSMNLGVLVDSVQTNSTEKAADFYFANCQHSLAYSYRLL